MTRRSLLLASKCEQPHCPVDDVKLNAFVLEYNDYIAALQRGELNIKQWARVLRAWEHLR